jgi:RHS repeat-associated protein
VTLLYSQRGALIGATKVSGQTTLGEWYGHDASGRRISRTVSSTTNNVTTFPDEEYFAWTGGNVTGRVDKTGVVTQSFLFEGVDRPLRLRAGLLRYYYELDLAGNVRRLRRPDGTDAGGYRYAGFGGELTNNVPPAVDQPLRWKARWWSEHSRLYDVRARQWSPDIGSFTSIDELQFHESRGTLWSWPGSSPLLWLDPWGRGYYVDTGVEGDFLRNADTGIKVAAFVTVSALTLGTGDAVFAVTRSIAVALGAAGVVGGVSAEGFMQAYNGCFDGWGLVDSAYDGGTFGFQVGSLLDLAQSGMNAAPGGRVPNPWGARGKPSTQALNERLAQQLKDADYEITNGGNKLPEEYIPGPGVGARALSSRTSPRRTEMIQFVCRRWILARVVGYRTEEKCEILARSSRRVGGMEFSSSRRKTSQVVAREFRFFQTRGDLIGLLQAIEAVAPLEYVRRGRFHAADDGATFRFAISVPRLGVSRAGDQVRDESFLVAREGYRWKISSRALSDGTLASSFDVDDNPGALVLAPGGDFEGGAVIAGWVATRKDVDDGLELLSIFGKQLRARCRKIKSYWVGEQARLHLSRGCRLSTSITSSAKYDLSQ